MSTEKIIGVSRTKARLVACAFEEMDGNIIREDSPTCGRKNSRLILLITNLNRWKINTMDIKSVFLQGKPIERVVYLKPLKEAHTNKIWKLNTTVYGLDDAPRAWYFFVKEELLKTGTITQFFTGIRTINYKVFYPHMLMISFGQVQNGLLRMLLKILGSSTQSVKKKQKYLTI